MLSLFRARQPHNPQEAATAQPMREPNAQDSAELLGAIQSIARLSTRLGQDAAQVRGEIDDATQLSRRGADSVQQLSRQVSEVQQAQEGIAQTTRASHEAVVKARHAVEDVGREVAEVVNTLRKVSEAAGEITKIALQTRLVAFNASVEAKRAGEAGRGFGVVADAVKDLSARVESSSKDILGTVRALDDRIAGLAREIQTRRDGTSEGAFHKALAEVDDGVSRIAEAASDSQRICSALGEHMGQIEQEIGTVVSKLGAANQRSEAFLNAGEALIELVADCGVETADTPYIKAAQQAASELAQALEQGLQSGAITPAQLWDDHYKPVPGTQPAQHATSLNAFTDRMFPEIQERWLALSDKVVFCIAADRNGYISTHNRRYCQAQRPGDVTWNTANSRWRRIFNDRTGLASARNQKPFLLQTYRRDMGGGQFVVLKEAAAPIVVQGRHWGGLRLAFRF